MGTNIQTGQSGLVEYRTHHAWAVIWFTGLFLILVFRFFQLQILRGEEYEKRAQIDHIGKERVPPRRGGVLDREGRPLAHNISEHALVVVPHYLERNPETLPRLRELLGLTDDQYRDVALKVQKAMTRQRRFNPLVVIPNAVSDRCPHDGSELTAGEPQPFLWCPACGGRFEPLTSGQTRCAHDETALEFAREGRVGRCPECGATWTSELRCPEDGADLQPRTAALVCPSCKRPFDNQVAIVTAHLHELPGLSITSVLRRHYPERFRLCHVLGFMNEVSADDLKQFGERYHRGDYIGRAGLERALEGDPAQPDGPNLRGEAGTEVFVRDYRGVRRPPTSLTRSMTNLRSIPAAAGDDVRLTIDLEVQKIVEQALRPHPSAAAVVLDVQTGYVLALFSKPGFDPNVWSGRLTADAKREYDANPYAPMINKAITGFAPGSVYKVVTAVAALEEGIVDAKTTYNCPGYYEFGGRRFRCHDRGGHGDVNLVQALQYSCDVYFYRIGELLGMDRLERYATEVFGLATPSGIELREQLGRVPSKDWHRRNSPNGWMPGFTLSTAVGQGAVLSSPLQIARIYAALANGGRLLKTRLVLERLGPEGEVRRRFMPETEHLLGIAPEHLALVREGLFATVNAEDGTGTAARVDGVLVAGKTGTAEAKQVKRDASPEIQQWLTQDHAWFAAYAPVDDPQIAVAVFIEHGGSGGKIAAPVAREIIEQYFRRGHGRLPEPPEPTAPVGPAVSGPPDDDLDGIR